MDMLTFSGDDPLGMAQVGVWEVKDLVCKTGKDGRSRPRCTKDDEPDHYERWYEHPQNTSLYADVGRHRPFPPTSHHSPPHTTHPTHHSPPHTTHPTHATHHPRLELDEVDKGRVNVAVYYSDLVPLVPLNGAPLTKQQASAVRK